MGTALLWRLVRRFMMVNDDKLWGSLSTVRMRVLRVVLPGWDSVVEGGGMRMGRWLSAGANEEGSVRVMHNP